MGEWGEEFQALLNGEASEIRDPGDISLVLDRRKDYWHPNQVRAVDPSETIERPRIGDMNKDIATAMEQYFADDYQSQKADSGPMDVRLTLTPAAHNWPVQVKTANYYRKAGDGTRKGSFKFRQHEYEDMPDDSFFQFYVNQVFFDEDREFQGDMIQAEKEDTGREAYIENLGRMLVPKELFEQYFEADWTSSGYWNLKWEEVFGEHPAGSPFFGFTMENYEEETGDGNYRISDFSKPTTGNAR